MLYRSLCNTPAPHCPPQREIRIPLRDGRDLYFGDDILRGHILTLGGPRTGKTNFLLQLSRASLSAGVICFFRCERRLLAAVSTGG